MAKTFNDIHGNTHELDVNCYDISTDFNEDILTNKITGYFVEINESKHEVDERTYEAVKNYLENC